jgi:chromosome segregation ATPase
MPWKQRALSNLERENASLRSEIVKLRHELRTKQTQLGGLELALVQRLQTIDQLNAKLDQSREQVRRLGLENEILTAMIAAPAPEALDAAMLSPK